MVRAVAAFVVACFVIAPATPVKAAPDAPIRHPAEMLLGPFQYFDRTGGEWLRGYEVESLSKSRTAAHRSAAGSHTSGSSHVRFRVCNTETVLSVPISGLVRTRRSCRKYPPRRSGPWLPATVGASGRVFVSSSTFPNLHNTFRITNKTDLSAIARLAVPALPAFVISTPSGRVVGVLPRPAQR